MSVETHRMRHLLWSMLLVPLCFLVHAENHDDETLRSWKDLSLIIHRNGEPDPCGGSRFPADYMATVERITNKFKMETFLTNLVAESLEDPASCGSPDNATAPIGLLGFCDMGPLRTPILPDHQQLSRTRSGTLPCRWYTREGLRIASVEQLQRLVQKNATQQTCANPQDGCSSVRDFHIYGVPAGRVFMFAPSYVGEIFDLRHLETLPNPQDKVYLKVLSTNPRIFDIYNAFTGSQADRIVDRALSETSPSARMSRSTTGSSTKTVFRKRTSENAFDTHGKAAMEVKSTIMELLCYDEYPHGNDDGLQILRYNQTQAYVDHMDYLDDPSGTDVFNFDSAGKGGNRFATVLLYMTDLPEGGGGETVFSNAWPIDLPDEERMELSEALRVLRESGDAEAAGLSAGSWEEKLVARCRSRLTVTPARGRAVLFYSQFPNGKEDLMSKHGGCPVLKGEKWAANMWVWNTPKKDQMGAPLREDLVAKGYKPKAPDQLTAIFVNTGKDHTLKNAELWYDEGMYWGQIGHESNPLQFNTYEGHRWNVRVDGKVVKNFVIGRDKVQRFEI